MTLFVPTVGSSASDSTLQELLAQFNRVCKYEVRAQQSAAAKWSHGVREISIPLTGNSMEHNALHHKVTQSVTVVPWVTG